MTRFRGSRTRREEAVARIGVLVADVPPHALPQRTLKRAKPKNSLLTGKNTGNLGASESVVDLLVFTCNVTRR
jgi:hypothetical protein